MSAALVFCVFFSNAWSYVDRLGPRAPRVYKFLYSPREHWERRTGWQPELLYLALPNVEPSQQRVAERVAHGGHAIAPADIARRFPRSLGSLLEHYAAAADETHCLLNDRPVPPMVSSQGGSHRVIVDDAIYHQLVEKATP